ncbi:MAG: biotin/lipoyl-binding protein [Calditrichaeota bacterium]|nr:biotin/lipoyl-binding protein [Calditrichota bacterium]
MKEKEITLEINGKDYKVKIHRFSAEEAEISVDETLYRVGLKDLGIEEVAYVKPQPAPRGPQATAPKTSLTQKPSPALHRPKVVSDGSAIKSPLPGLILKVLVNEGDMVKAGQPVILIEAMKMENEVNATADGVVIDIRHKEGDTVNQGDVLILLKPAEG